MTLQDVEGPDLDHGLVLCIKRMKVRGRVVIPVHPDQDAVEAADGWHGRSLFFLLVGDERPDRHMPGEPCKIPPMETPLTPMEFAPRARKLYAQREAVVDGERRLSYEQFFERCDRA